MKKLSALLLFASVLAPTGASAAFCCYAKGIKNGKSTPYRNCSSYDYDKEVPIPLPVQRTATLKACRDDGALRCRILSCDE